MDMVPYDPFIRVLKDKILFLRDNQNSFHPISDFLSRSPIVGDGVKFSKWEYLRYVHYDYGISPPKFDVKLATELHLKAISTVKSGIINTLSQNRFLQ